MTEKPVGTVSKTPRAEAQEAALRLLEDAIADSRENGCVGVAVVMLNRNGETWTRASVTVDRHRMLAGIVDLMFDYQKGPRE